MESNVEAKVKALLQNWFHLKDHDCGTVVDLVMAHARVAGFDLDRRFAEAGLGAGPESRVASRLVGRSLLAMGDETSDYEIRKTLESWLRLTPRKGR